MQNNLLPRSVLDSLDRISRNFVWGTKLEKRKLHLVGWEKIIKPKEEGGLGLQAAKPKNLAFLAKLSWRFISKKDKLGQSA